MPSAGALARAARVSTDDAPENVITFRQRDPDAFPIQRKPFDYRGCQHKAVLVDVELRQVECDSCGAVLDPIETLLRFSDDINIRWRAIQEYEAKVRRQSEQRRARRTGA